MTDALGDRMKLYEQAEAGRKFMPLLPIIARLDGRAFSSFTRGLNRPFDKRMTDAMIATTIALVNETHACMGYTQSDEITLAWHATSPVTQLWFDGKIHKMVSQLAAQATLHFYRGVATTLPAYAEKLPTFDARAWNVPNRTEGANAFLWREQDATKNSISMLAQTHFSHRQLQGVNTKQMLAMLEELGVHWEEYPASFKRGTFVRKRLETAPFSPEDLAQLPPKHTARSNPALVVTRYVTRVMDMPPFGRVANREAVIFEGADPEMIV